MALMIPSSIYKGCASPGEHDVFNRLEKDPLTKNWIVLHSLDIANHLKQVSGEADFVVIVPSKGLLVLEVKAHYEIEYTANGWYYGKDKKYDAKGPFKQSSSAMHSLRKELLKSHPQFSSILFWSGVVFPYTSFEVKSPEWHSWQVINRQLYNARPLAASIENILDQAKNFLIEEKNFSWSSHSVEPTPEQCNQISQFFRPQFEFIESSKAKHQRLSSELQHYTAEQFNALDAMESNPRVAFTGAAGTGKTLLAIEAARRESGRDQKVLLLCFNSLLGRWLENQTKDISQGITCKTLHKHMIDVAKISINDFETDSNFWHKTLPELALEKLLEEPGESNIYDVLIIDEAQDILREEYLDFLDFSLKGGLSTGKWRMLGDFEKQAIYKSSALPLHEVLTKRSNNVPVYSLTNNCRNTPRIAETARLLCNIDPYYKKILRPDNSIDPKYGFFDDEEKQLQLLIKNIDELLKLNYSPSDIVILSRKKDDECIASKIKFPGQNFNIKPYAQSHGENCIRYCSIHSFKGLEAPAIIVTDIDKVSDQTSASLFYIALTRALEQLVLLTSETAKNELMQAVFSSKNT